MSLKMGPYSSFCLRKLEKLSHISTSKWRGIYYIVRYEKFVALLLSIPMEPPIRCALESSTLRPSASSPHAFDLFLNLIYSLKWWNLWHSGRSCYIILMSNVKLGRKVSTKFTLPISSRPILIKTLWKVNFVQVTKAVSPVRISLERILYESKFREKKRFSGL